MKVLSLDPSFRAYGWALIDSSSLIACGCILTSSKNVSGLVTDLDTASLTDISQTLKEIITKYQPNKIIFENSVGSQSSRASQTLGFVKGLTISAAIFSGIPYTTIKARSVKMKLTNNKDATKEDILAEVINKFPAFLVLTKKWNKVKLYGASDAVAVYLASI